jgi:hypothetical protein
MIDETTRRSGSVCVKSILIELSNGTTCKIENISDAHFDVTLQDSVNKAPWNEIYASPSKDTFCLSMKCRDRNQLINFISSVKPARNY